MRSYCFAIVTIFALSCSDKNRAPLAGATGTSGGTGTGSEPETDGGKDASFGAAKTFAAATNPVSLALTGTHLYWVEGGATGALVRMPLVGGAKETLIASIAQPTHVRVADSGLVYVLGQGAAAGAGELTLWQPTSPPTKIAKDEVQPLGLSGLGGDVYWIAGDQAAAGPFFLRKANKDLAPDNVGTATASFTSHSIALNTTHAYVPTTLGGSGAIFRAAFSGGGGLESWATVTDALGDVALSTSDLFVATTTGKILAFALANQTQRTFMEGLTSPAWLAATAERLYWVETGAIVSAPLAGGEKKVHEQGLPPIQSMTLSGDSLFVGVNLGTEQKILRISLK